MVDLMVDLMVAHPSPLIFLLLCDWSRVSQSRMDARNKIDGQTGWCGSSSSSAYYGEHSLQYSTRKGSSVCPSTASLFRLLRHSNQLRLWKMESCQNSRQNHKRRQQLQNE